MSDIAERLRNCSSHSGISYCVACKYEKDECCEERLMAEAADEIIRLRDDLYYDYLELKEELEAERKKHEWISVKERLPEDYKLKLVIQVEGGDQYYGLDWLSIKGENLWFKANTRITHWMPLPDPPKGEEE